MSYYRTCGKCGANLDPGEQCDCEKVKKYQSKEGLLLIGYDLSPNDISTLTVGVLRANLKDKKVEIINMFYGDEALELYSHLTNPIMNRRDIYEQSTN